MSSLIPIRRLDLRDFTPARVSLAATGHSIATSDVLNFQLAHAQARDAVHAVLHLPSFAQRLRNELPMLAEASIPVLQLQSNAPDRAAYLRQPILGRTLHPDSVVQLQPASSDLAIIIADVWQWTPFMFVILLAGLTAIPPNLYEAAELDGVDGWRAFWLITVPLLAPMMLLAITFRLLDAVKLFDTIFIMTGGGPGTNTYTSSFYLYTIGFTQFHLGEATAGAWIILILTAIVITFLVRRLLRPEAT